MDHTSIFYISKKKVWFLIGGALGFIILAIYLIFFNFSQDAASFTTATRILVFVAALASILFFGLCFFVGIRILKTKSPGLIINDEGITDHSSYASIGLTKWKDINRLEILNIAGTPILLVYLNRPEELLAKANFWQKFWLKRNLAWFGTTLSFSATSLDCNFQQLLEAVTLKFNAVKNQNRPPLQ